MFSIGSKMCSVYHNNSSILKRLVSDVYWRLSSFLIELALSIPGGLPEGSPQEQLMPIPSLNGQESSEPDSIPPGTQFAVCIV